MQRISTTLFHSSTITSIIPLSATRIWTTYPSWIVGYVYIPRAQYASKELKLLREKAREEKEKLKAEKQALNEKIAQEREIRQQKGKEDKKLRAEKQEQVEADRELEKHEQQRQKIIKEAEKQRKLDEAEAEKAMRKEIDPNISKLDKVLVGPPKNMSAFMLFHQERKFGSKLHYMDVLVESAQKWESLPTNEKFNYYDKARQDKQRYEREMIEYKAKQGQEQQEALEPEQTQAT